MKMWISRYALTEGVVKEQEAHPDYPGYFKGDDGYVWQKVGTFAHATEAAALAAAEAMRLKKIASLRKQVEKLEKLRF